jgi:uncharacterized Rmd1/YagE family protein
MYYFPLLPGYGPNTSIRSSNPQKTKTGQPIFNFSDVEEAGYQGTYFPSQDESSGSEIDSSSLSHDEISHNLAVLVPVPESDTDTSTSSAPSAQVQTGPSNAVMNSTAADESHVASSSVDMEEALPFQFLDSEESTFPSDAEKRKTPIAQQPTQSLQETDNSYVASSSVDMEEALPFQFSDSEESTSSTGAGKSRTPITQQPTQSLQESDSSAVTSSTKATEISVPVETIPARHVESSSDDEDDEDSTERSSSSDSTLDRPQAATGNGLNRIADAESQPKTREVEDGDDNVGQVVFFEYGVVVFFGLTEKQEYTILEDVEGAGVFKQKLKEDDWEVEECHFVVRFGKKLTDSYLSFPSNSTIPTSPVRASTITFSVRHFCSLSLRSSPDFYWLTALKSRSHLLKLSIAHALAQSTLLSYYESLTDKTLSSSETMAIPNQLAALGALKLKRREAMKVIGRLFKLRRDVNLVRKTGSFFSY